MLKKVGLGLIGLSYSYGFCRCWTLPIWPDAHKMSFRELGTRIAMSTGSGFAYIIPPVCFTKYLNMCGRIYDRKRGIDQSYVRMRSGHWYEWGIYHPRMF